ncbi:MAG TPA: myxosortase-dependent metalloprotease, MXAN_2677/MXAN_2678 family [Myxococcales bacterium]
MKNVRRQLWSLAALALATLGPAPAGAFVRSRGTSGGNGAPGPELFWCTRKPSYVVNEKGSQNAGAQASIEAVRRSFETWAKTGCSDLSFSDQGTTARADVGYDPKAADNQDLVVWREVDCDRVVPRTDPCLSDGGCNNKYGCWDHEANTIALTTTSFDNQTGEILDADIELNGAGFEFTTADSPPCDRPPPRGSNDCVATDVQNTVTHEVGHVLGLDHSPDPSSTMFASEALGETNKRVLSADDIDGLCAIYPEGAASSPACPGASGDGGSGGGGGCSSAGAGGVLGALGLLAALGALRRRR